MTTFSAIRQIGATQTSNAGTTSNNADSDIVRALAQPATGTVGSTNIATITNASTTWAWERNMTWRYTNASPGPNAQVTIAVPSAPERAIFGFINRMTQPAKVWVSGQALTPPIIEPGDGAVLSHNGTQVERLGIRREVFREFLRTTGHLTTSATCAMWVSDRTLRFDNNFSGATAYAKNGPNGGSVVFNVLRQGSTIGTVTFANTSGAAASATFSTIGTGSETFTKNQRLELFSPDSLNSIDNVVINLRAWRE